MAWISFSVQKIEVLLLVEEAFEYKLVILLALIIIACVCLRVKM